MIPISHIIENYPKLAKSPYAQILPFLQCDQNTKQFISVDSPSWAEQNGTNSFVVACMVVEIFWGAFGPLKVELWWLLWVNNSTIEHDAMKLIASFHSKSNVLSKDTNISHCVKLLKIGENPLIIDLVFCQNLAIFAMCWKH